MSIVMSIGLIVVALFAMVTLILLLVAYCQWLGNKLDL
jgi:hypothetical protein